MHLLLVLFAFIIPPQNASAGGSPLVSPKADSAKAILYIFTGSDWCSNCKRFEKNVLNDSVFRNTLDRNRIQVQIIDFPQRKKLPEAEVIQNKNIADKFGFSGSFPTFVLAGNQPDKFRTFYFSNESALLFSRELLNELKRLNE